MNTDHFEPIESNTLRDSVVETFRRAIVEGVLLPGEQVNQAKIAGRLGISRGPVREALSHLEREGLIRQVPHKGTFVTDITAADIDELYSMRRVLEGFALRCFFERSNPDDQERLRQTVAEMQERASANNVTRLTELDLRFHHFICQGAHHNLLMQIWRSIEQGVRRSLSLRHSIYRHPSDIVGTHPAVLAAIQAKDLDRASQLLDAHILEAGDLLHHSWQGRALTESRGHLK